MMTIQARNLHITALIITIILLLNFSPSHATQSMEIEVLGYLGNFGLIPEPIPANYTGTPAPTDYLVLYELVLQIKFLGTTNCRLMEINVSQTTQFEYITRVVIGEVNTSSLGRVVTPGDSFMILIGASKGFYVGSEVFLSIKTVEDGLISVNSLGFLIPSKIDHLSTWSDSFSNTSSNMNDLPLISLLICFVAYISYRRFKHQKK